MPINKLVNLGFYLSLQTNKFVIFSKGGGKLFSFFMPQLFFFNTNSSYKFLFTSKHLYSSFLTNLRFYTNCLQQIYFLKLRLKGLGYRIRRFSRRLYRFYFTRTNYIYFHLPIRLIFKKKKKKIILLSTDYHLVRLVFANLMLLHRVGPYNRRGFTYPRQIIILKLVKKIV